MVSEAAYCRTGLGFCSMPCMVAVVGRGLPGAFAIVCRRGAGAGYDAGELIAASNIKLLPTLLVSRYGTSFKRSMRL